MSGFSQALWLWLPVLIFKVFSAVFRTIWRFNLWALQTLSGVPLYYAKPEYRIPGIFMGTVGMICLCNTILMIISIETISVSQQMLEDTSTAILVNFCTGIVLLVLCRILIRKGSI